MYYFYKGVVACSRSFDPFLILVHIPMWLLNKTFCGTRITIRTSFSLYKKLLISSIIPPIILQTPPVASCNHDQQVEFHNNHNKERSLMKEGSPADYRKEGFKCRPSSHSPGHLRTRQVIQSVDDGSQLAQREQGREDATVGAHEDDGAQTPHGGQETRRHSQRRDGSLPSCI